MNNEDILRMVEQAGGVRVGKPGGKTISNSAVAFSMIEFERCVALVQAATAEECAKVCEEMEVALHPSQTITDRCARAIRTKYQNQTKSKCAHEWVDARNSVVQSGEVCLNCNSIREGNQHPTSSGAGTRQDNEEPEEGALDDLSDVPIWLRKPHA